MIKIYLTKSNKVHSFITIHYILEVFIFMANLNFVSLLYKKEIYLCSNNFLLQKYMINQKFP